MLRGDVAWKPVPFALDFVFLTEYLTDFVTRGRLCSPFKLYDNYPGLKIQISFFLTQTPVLFSWGFSHRPVEPRFRLWQLESKAVCFAYKLLNLRLQVYRTIDEICVNSEPFDWFFIVSVLFRVSVSCRRWRI